MVSDLPAPLASENQDSLSFQLRIFQQDVAGITPFPHGVDMGMFQEKRRVGNFLQFAAALQFFLEVRHPGWFAKKEIREELFSTLKEINIGAVITDTAGRRDCAHMYLAVPKTFIRYVGNSLHKTDFPRIDDWINRIKYWLDSGIKEIYFFMHMHDEAKSPELTVYLVDQLNKVCGLDLQRPKFIESFKPPKASQKILF